MYSKQLKNSILQQAIQGKLVRQIATEGTAKELLEDIGKEKATLIKEGKTKQKDKELKSITKEEIPFEIPSSWEWVRLGEIVNIIQGTSYDKGDIINNNFNINNIRIIRGGNIQNGKLILCDNDVFLKDNYKNSLFNLCQYDILIVSSTGSKEVIGKPAFCSDLEYKNIQIGAFLRIIRLTNKNFFEYIKLIFLSNYYREYIRKLSVGTNINNIKNEYINNFLVPLPPLKEQQRIVKKIESLEPLLKDFEENETKLNEIEANFPKQLKNSILQQAIQGKLVKQIATEGTAKELLEDIRKEKATLIKEGKIKQKDKELKPITAEEIPFEIPSSWEWVRLGEIGFCQTGTTPSKQNKEYYGNKYQFIKPDNILINGNITRANEFLSEKGINKGRLIEKGSILMVCIGTIGKVGIINEDCSCNQQINSITCYNHIYNKYIFYVMFSKYFQELSNNKASQTTLPILNKTNFEELLLPLPPLQEQQRIVEKVDKILEEIDLMEN